MWRPFGRRRFEFRVFSLGLSPVQYLAGLLCLDYCWFLFWVVGCLLAFFSDVCRAFAQLLSMGFNIILICEKKVTQKKKETKKI